MSKLSVPLKRSGFMLLALALLSGTTAMNLSFFATETAYAGQLTARSLSLSSTAPGTVTTGAANSYTNGSSARHTVTFTHSASATVGAIVLQYCTTAIGSCTSPTGLNMASATKGTFTGTGMTDGNWTVGSDDLTTLSGRSGCTGTNGRTNCIAVRQTPGTNGGTNAWTLPFNAITNPNETAGFYVRIFTFASNTYSANTYGSDVDQGVVASSIVDPINITARVAETLGFSTTTSDSNYTAVTAEGSACDPLSGTGAMTLGDSEGVLSATTQYNDSAYWRVFTNAASGITVQYSGKTLEKGSDNIDALSSEVAGATGTEQFGFGIKATGSTITNVDTAFGGAGQIDLATGYDGAGEATPLYNFAVASETTPVTIASKSGYVTCSTAENRYLANISTATAAGTYTTIITYYAVPTF